MRCRRICVSGGAVPHAAPDRLLHPAGLSAVDADHRPVVAVLLGEQGGGAGPRHPRGDHRPHDDHPAELVEERRHGGLLPEGLRPANTAWSPTPRSVPRQHRLVSYPKVCASPTPLGLLPEGLRLANIHRLVSYPKVCAPPTPLGLLSEGLCPANTA